MTVLLDTGPWVALVDRSESRHLDCVRWLRDFVGKLASSEAVLTEVLYLLNFSNRAQQAALEFVFTGAVAIVPSSVDSLKRAGRLMSQYADLPMDFADATLVVLGEEFGLAEIATFDQRDFGIYRLKNRRSFVVVP